MSDEQGRADTEEAQAAEKIEFAMMNDQTGDRQMATLGNCQELQRQGYSIVGAAQYEQAMQMRRDAAEAARRAAMPVDEGNAERVHADALLAVKRTYPGADLGDEGEQMAKDAEKNATDKPVKTPRPAPDSVAAGTRPGVAPQAQPDEPTRRANAGSRKER